MEGDRFDPRVPFTRADGLAAGISEWQLRGTAYVRLFRNVYVAREVTRTLAVRARAALLAAPPGSTVSHHTAAVLWGGIVPASSPIHLCVPDKRDLRVDGIRTHRRSQEWPSTRVRRLAVTTPAQTFLDLASDLDLVDLVVLGDRLVRRNVTTTEHLIAAADEWAGRHAQLACRAASLVRKGVDSAPESRLRMLIVLAGLPEPTVNLILRDPENGDWQRRFELAYEDLMLAMEYEGRQHREDAEIWTADIERREDLDRRTWRVVQVVSDGLFKIPLRTLQRIEQARLDRGAPPTGPFAEEWRRYFPGRDAA